MTGFFYSLDRNLEDVDHFYTKKYQELTRKLKIWVDQYGDTLDSARGLEKEERHDLLAGLFELRNEFRKLHGYGEINRRGFVKITKKLDKKIEGSHAQKKYLQLKVDPCSFASDTELLRNVEKINSWISILSEVVGERDDTTDRPATISTKLHRWSSREALRIPGASWLALEQSIRKDDAQATVNLLIKTKEELPNIPERQFQQFLKGLLQRAITSRSRNCITVLLSRIVFLDDAEDINKRNCVHRLVISIGRAYADLDYSADGLVADAENNLYTFLTPAASPSKAFRQVVRKDHERTGDLTASAEPIQFLQFLLNSFSEEQRSALSSRDVAGRTPLHFAAEYGITAMVQLIVEQLHSWGMFDTEHGIDGPFWQDIEGWAPLHLAVIAGHPVTTQALLDAETKYGSRTSVQHVRSSSSKNTAVLIVATKSNFVEVVRTLVKANADINQKDEQGETALHVAARFGHVECARILLEGSDVQMADTEVRETTYGWTPLFTASVDGHLPIVELLIEANADVEKIDWSGWTAKEHAALRGHVAIATRLAELSPEPVPESDASSSNGASSPPNPSVLTERTSNGTSTSKEMNGKATETIKEFGHRYLKDGNCMILVSLGTMDMHKKIQAVHLDQIPMTNASSTQLDTALSVVVSAKEAEGESEVIDLPIHDNISTEPIVFHAIEPSKVKLLFDLVPTYAGNHERIVGRGVALLSSIKSNLGAKRMPLQGDLSVPIISAGDMDVIGSVTFNFLVITPFSHPKMNVSQDQTYWKKVAQTMVIGHRGMGKNFAAGRRSLQLGENTVQSFVSAANLGAQYVEFDVQLTKDHVPVIYHDFLVSETGIDAPVHTLTAEQFLALNETQSSRSHTPRHSRPGSPKPFENPAVGAIRAAERPSRLRSMSVGGGSTDTVDMEERMKHTRDFKKKGFKGNSRGNHIQEPFATLEQLFRQVPTTTGFNIEMKYPMLSESQNEDMDWYTIELNSFVDTVLEKVYDLGDGRNIIFSSFNPDICLLLSFKQPNIPVLFLTDAGICPVADIRASSLQEAIRFAARWKLLGIVAACEPFIIAPRLIKVVKESGLVCLSYGTMNNDVDKARLQEQQGIDAVIVDSVLKIRQGLAQGAELAVKHQLPAQAQTQKKITETIHDIAGGVQDRTLKGVPPSLDRVQQENVLPKTLDMDSSASVTSSVVTKTGSDDAQSDQSWSDSSNTSLTEQKFGDMVIESAKHAV